MNTNGENASLQNQETGSPAGSLSIEHLVRTASFPVYGLVQTPNDLTLHGIGYSTADAGVGRSAPPWSSNPSQVLWQVSLVYGYPSGHQYLSPRLELSTTSIAHYPASAPNIEDLARGLATHYQSVDEVPTLGSQPADFLVERFALIEGEALAVVAYTPDTPPLMLLPGQLIGTQIHELPDASAVRIAPTAALSMATPDWSFTLRNDEMWVEGRAYGWTQTAIFQVLHQLAALRDKPDVLAECQREIAAWQSYTRLS